MKRNKLLLVDDEVDITASLSEGLQKHGFEVDVFNEPRKSLSQFKPNYYDSIVLDVRMPQMNGFLLAREIWARDHNARICFLSAFEIYESEANSIFASFKTHCFIKKPITPSDLVKHLRAHVLPVH